MGYGITVKGSLADVASDVMDIGEAFMKADVVVMCDVSGSMLDNTGDRQTRYERACRELEKIQERFPGRVALLAFSDIVRFHPRGVPDLIAGGTDMVSVLELARKADVPGMQFFLISDGLPNDPGLTLRVAEKFQNKIHTVFIGQEHESGREFLQRLASATGGASTSTVEITNHMLEFATLLLEAKP